MNTIGGNECHASSKFGELVPGKSPILLMHCVYLYIYLKEIITNYELCNLVEIEEGSRNPSKFITKKKK